MIYLHCYFYVKSLKSGGHFPLMAQSNLDELHSNGSVTSGYHTEQCRDGAVTGKQLCCQGLPFPATLHLGKARWISIAQGLGIDIMYVTSKPRWLRSRCDLSTLCPFTSAWCSASGQSIKHGKRRKQHGSLNHHFKESLLSIGNICSDVTEAKNYNNKTLLLFDQLYIFACICLAISLPYLIFNIFIYCYYMDF